MEINRAKLGAAIIVRNNEKTISETLESIIPVCSQIVVVDTGSYDKTPQICTRLGAEVHFFKWVDDFATARNYALSLLKTEWVLVIDSDEILDHYNFLKHSNIKINEKAGGINVKIENYLDKEDLSNKSYHRYTRIFRNHKDIRFIGRIHEQISESIFNAGYDIIESEILIKHFGYQEVSQDKVQRNQELLKREIEDSPDDPWKIYHLAAAEFAGKNFTESEAHFKQIFNSELLSTEQQEISKLRLSQIALRNELFDEIMHWTDFISSDIDREGFRKYIRGTAKLLAKDYKNASILFRSEEVVMSSLVNKEQLKKAYQILDYKLKGNSTIAVNKEVAIA